MSGAIITILCSNYRYLEQNKKCCSLILRLKRTMANFFIVSWLFSSRLLLRSLNIASKSRSTMALLAERHSASSRVGCKTLQLSFWCKETCSCSHLNERTARELPLKNRDTLGVVLPLRSNWIPNDINFNIWSINWWNWVWLFIPLHGSTVWTLGTRSITSLPVHKFSKFSRSLIRTMISFTVDIDR